MLQLIVWCHNNAFVFSQAEYCDTHYIYIFCNGNVHAAVEYQRCFPDSRIPFKSVLSRDHQTTCETGCLPSVCVQSDREVASDFNIRQNILGLEGPTTVHL